MTVYYFGFRDPTVNDDICYGNNETDRDVKGNYSEQNLRKIHSNANPVSIETPTIDNKVISSDKLTCLSGHCFALQRNGDLVKILPGFPSEPVNPSWINSDLQIISIFAEPTTDKLLLLVNNKSKNRQEIYVYHETAKTEKRVLMLDDDQKVKKFVCGYSMGILVTENEDTIFKVTKCKNSDWILHRQPSPGIIIDEISCGKEHVIALSRDGQVYTMGSSTRGQLGLGSTQSRDIFTKVDTLEPLRFSMVVAGGWHSLVLSENGDLYAWGWNESGQVGVTSLCVDDDSDIVDGVQQHLDSFKQDEEKTKDDIPKLVFLPTLVDTSLDLTFCRIHAGSRHSAAVSDKGDLYTWGWNGYGQLGHGDQTDKLKPYIVEYFKEHKQCKVTDIECGPWSTFVFTESKSEE